MLFTIDLSFLLGNIENVLGERKLEKLQRGPVCSRMVQVTSQYSLAEDYLIKIMKYNIIYNRGKKTLML